jgi:hypothetical protein
VITTHRDTEDTESPAACLGRSVPRCVVIVALGAAAITVAAVSPSVATGVYATYADVQPILSALADVLPRELKSAAETSWSTWATTHDNEVRGRLEGGDLDTIVNWLLLGTTFTSRPRAILETTATDVVQIPAAVASRARDLVDALRTPGTDERRLFAAQLLERRGYRAATAQERQRLEDFLLAEVARVAREQAGFARELAASRTPADVSAEFAARSRMFRTRGLSLDTSLAPDFALEQSLRELRARGLVNAGSVRNVAVIGPGLDFSDKSSGYDFYPQQTVQPFALLDSLVRVGLAPDARSVRLTTLDLSPRVNDHLAAIRRRAAAGQPYSFRLPLDFGISWNRDLIAYWKAAGDRIGRVASAPDIAGSDIRMRTITVAPEVVRRIEPQDLNIVVQRLDDRRFDLIVATNVFIYYDLLDQVLALANVGAMLAPGGFLLSNNSVLELPSSTVRSVGYLTVQYSDRADDGDHVVWYRRGSSF